MPKRKALRPQEFLPPAGCSSAVVIVSALTFGSGHPSTQAEATRISNAAYKQALTCLKGLDLPHIEDRKLLMQGLKFRENEGPDRQLSFINEMVTVASLSCHEPDSSGLNRLKKHAHRLIDDLIKIKPGRPKEWDDINIAYTYEEYILPKWRQIEKDRKFLKKAKPRDILGEFKNEAHVGTQVKWKWKGHDGRIVAA
jgi:hypothetical protein